MVIRKRGILYYALKMMSMGLGSLLGLFFGCDNSHRATQPEYGVPYAEFEFKGTVCAKESNQPLPGIMVTVRDSPEDENQSLSGFTDSSGKYSLECIGYSGPYTWVLKAQDVDSIKNGLFVSKDTVISISDDQLIGEDGNWYRGKVEKTVDIHLESES